MKKETLADKLARKSFESDAFRKSWAVHMQAFGPILEPAFAEDYQAKVHLAAALNKLSRRDIRGALDKLKALQKSCDTDVDKAAWLFFMDLCFDLAGETEQMLAFYQEAGEYHHRFYMPYLKIARTAQADAVYDAAETNYRAAIACLDDTAPNKTILASCYTNLAGCLTYMHRYEEAYSALMTSRQLLQTQPGRDATAAVLYAAMGKAEDAENCLSWVKEENPQLEAAVRTAVEQILRGENPHFTPVPLETEALDAFWVWFSKKEGELKQLLSQEDYDAVFGLMQPRLAALLPFLERDPELGIQPEEKGCTITLADFYMVALRQGYEALLERCPENLQTYWHFEIAR